MKKNSLNLVSFPVGSYACNCSILYSDLTREALIIDPGNDHDLILKKIKELNINVKKLLHTHAHFDHIGRSSEVSAATNATIHLHKDDQFLYDMLPQQGLFFGQKVGIPKPIDAYLVDGETFSFDDPEINTFMTTLHTPGHTPGSCCFYSDYFDTPQLFAGDTLFAQSIGRTDLPGGNSNLIIKSIKERLLVLPEETRVTTGHGPATSIHQEKKHNPFLC
ncbi:MAG: MBL fold metallo-hydrolase [Alphaproteobacteria bacterium]|nr:MAG: MBL fold metallo-hydrolase [Alphaproteobacteria bacterium]